MKEHVSSGIHFLANHQIRDSVPGITYSGEWPVCMEMPAGFFLLGGHKKVNDSNCFSVAGTHNLLARIYLADSSLHRIPYMLNASMNAILRYRNGNRFNFWHQLPPFRKLFRGDTLFPHVMVRRPTEFRLKSRYINKAANVVEDADDTSLALSALMLLRRTGKQDQRFDSACVKSVKDIFDPYRDLNRKNYHWYNYLNDYPMNSGAYLTWHGEEYAFRDWNILKVIVHNATFYRSFSECYPFAYVPYIPYGSNDLDAVVNANVLTCLRLHNDTLALGYKPAVDLLVDISHLRSFDRVACYYPNRYQVPYAIALAYHSGVRELAVCRDSLTDFLMRHRNRDGSWSSRKWVNNGDRVQSTAYALNALIMLNADRVELYRQVIEQAVIYLMQQANHTGLETWWKGGVLFSGGTVVRLSLFWKSDAFTTALVLHCFALYQKILRDKWKE